MVPCELMQQNCWQVCRGKATINFMSPRQILLQGPGIRLETIDDGGFKVFVVRRPLTGCLGISFVIAAVGMVAAAFSWGTVMPCIHFPRDGAVPTATFIGIFGVIAVLLCTLTFAETVSALRRCYDRQLEFDHQRNELRLRNVPFFSQVMASLARFGSSYLLPFVSRHPRDITLSEHTEQKAEGVDSIGNIEHGPGERACQSAGRDR